MVGRACTVAVTYSPACSRRCGGTVDVCGSHAAACTVLSRSACAVSPLSPRQHAVRRWQRSARRLRLAHPPRRDARPARCARRWRTQRRPRRRRRRRAAARACALRRFQLPTRRRSREMALLLGCPAAPRLPRSRALRTPLTAQRRALPRLLVRAASRLSRGRRRALAPARAVRPPTAVRRYTLRPCPRQAGPSPGLRRAAAVAPRAGQVLHRRQRRATQRPGQAHVAQAAGVRRFRRA